MGRILDTTLFPAVKWRLAPTDAFSGEFQAHWAAVLGLRAPHPGGGERDGQTWERILELIALIDLRSKGGAFQLTAALSNKQRKSLRQLNIRIPKTVRLATLQSAEAGTPRPPDPVP